MSEVNIPLLRKAVEWVEAEAAKPDLARRWTQSHWVLGAHERARYLAAEVLWADRLNLSAADDALVAALEAYCGTCYCVAGYVAQLEDACYEHDAAPAAHPHAAEFAQERLGLSGDDAARLFASGNTAEEVRQIAEDIAGERL